MIPTGCDVLIEWHKHYVSVWDEGELVKAGKGGQEEAVQLAAEYRMQGRDVTVWNNPIWNQREEDERERRESWLIEGAKRGAA